MSLYTQVRLQPKCLRLTNLAGKAGVVNSCSIGRMFPDNGNTEITFTDGSTLKVGESVSQIESMIEGGA